MTRACQRLDEIQARKGPPVVSVDHFAYELRSQLRAAAALGATDILITSRELCKSVRMGTAFLDACCEAMQRELRSDDCGARQRQRCWDECPIPAPATLAKKGRLMARLTSASFRKIY
jgi:hypothetical protein